MADQPQQHGVGGVREITRLEQRLDEAAEMWARDLADKDAEIARLRTRCASLEEHQWYVGGVYADLMKSYEALEARCASLEAVVEAARGIALRQSPAHQALRQALVAFDQHATTTQEGTH